MAEPKRMLYVQTSGTDAPMRLYSPVVLATVARSMDIEATLYFLGTGITVVKKGEAEKVQAGDFPPLSEMLESARAAGVRMLVCDQSSRLMGLGSGDYMDGVEIVGAATLNDLVLDADGTQWF